MCGLVLSLQSELLSSFRLSSTDRSNSTETPSEETGRDWSGFTGLGDAPCLSDKIKAINHDGAAEKLRAEPGEVSVPQRPPARAAANRSVSHFHIQRRVFEVRLPPSLGPERVRPLSTSRSCPKCPKDPVT